MVQKCFCTPDGSIDPTFQMKYIPSRFVFNLMEILIIKQIPLFFEAPCSILTKVVLRGIGLVCLGLIETQVIKDQASLMENSINFFFFFLKPSLRYIGVCYIRYLLTISFCKTASVFVTKELTKEMAAIGPKTNLGPSLDDTWSYF